MNTRITGLLLVALPLTLTLATSGCGGEEEEDCVDRSCTTPPAAFCDGDLAVSYATTGSCQLDACRYATTTVDCAQLEQTCVAGACQP